MSDAPHLPWPPVIAEARSPFTAVRVAALLLARPRGFGERVAAVADALNAAHTDWLFETRVVADELLQLQSNWFSDFRTTTGFALNDSPNGTLLHLEDSSRMSGWLQRQVEKAEEACRAELEEVPVTAADFFATLPAIAAAMASCRATASASGR